MENNTPKLFDFLETAWNEQRSLDSWTGKGGAIMYRETLLGRSLTKQEKDAMEDGAYSISSVEGLKFLGLHDSDMEDGVYVMKRDGDYLVETWEGCLRTDHKDISEQEAKEMIAKAKENQP